MKAVMGPSDRMSQALGWILVQGVEIAGQSWKVTRAWPAALEDPSRGLVLELVGADGRVLGATLDARGVGLGTDIALTQLAPLTASGWKVLSHRFGKRAVLRKDDAGDYRKLATPKATRRALRRAAEVEAILTGVSCVPRPPACVAADTNGGMIDFAPAPGVSVRELLLDPATTVETATAVGSALGEVLATMAQVAHSGVVSRPAHNTMTAAATGSVRGGLPTHTLADEARVMDRWVRAACVLAPLSPVAKQELREQADAVLTELGQAEEQELVLVHRDLHDGQILVADNGALTILDWDTAAWAEPSLDPANLLAHLDLLVEHHPAMAGRVLGAAQGFRAGLATGGHPCAADPGRLQLWRRASAVRIAAVHAFRTP